MLHCFKGKKTLIVLVPAAVGYYWARRIRKYGALCVAGIGGRGWVLWGVNVFLIKRNDPDFKKVNIFPHKHTGSGGEG